MNSDQLAARGFQAAWRGLMGRRRFKKERDKLAAAQLGIDFNEVVTVVRAVGWIALRVVCLPVRL